AETRGKAKMVADCRMDVDRFTDLRALRVPSADGAESITDRLYLQNGFWVECKGPCGTKIYPEELEPPYGYIVFDRYDNAYCSEECAFEASVARRLIYEDS
nr:hypothetical protein [Dehalococcoidales bacterium]